MTKIIPKLSFSSSNFGYETANIEPDYLGKFGDSESPLSGAGAGGNKRSALSASDAECFSLCLGAGPLCGFWDVKPRRMKPMELKSVQPVLRKRSGPDVPANNSAPPGGVNGGAQSGPATPTTPTHDDNCDLLSALLAGGAASLSGSSETLAPSTPPAAAASAADHPVLHTEQREAIISKILERKAQQPVKIDFKIFLTANTATHWEAVVQDNTIYLRLPGVLSAGSKESFMVLLDFAEERLGCTSCIVCVRKSRADRAVVLRTFMFMGFQPLAPGAPSLAPLQHRHDYVFLHYSMR